MGEIPNHETHLELEQESEGKRMKSAAEKMSLTGRSSPPMINGDVVFEAPWQSRVFGMARVLCEQGLYNWDEFRVCLIAQIDQWQNTSPQEEYFYFDHFLAAFSDMVSQKELCSSKEVNTRAKELKARPHGHDH